MKKKNEKDCQEQPEEMKPAAITTEATEVIEATETEKAESVTVTLTPEALEEKLTEAYLKGLNTAIEAKMLEDMKELSATQSLPMSDGDIKSLDTLLRGRRSVWDSI